MKNLRLTLLLVLVAGVLSFFSFKNPEVKVSKTFVAAYAADTYKVNAQQSKVEWSGKKVAYGHNGTVDLAEGELQIDKNKLTGGKFTIDMTSIKNVDLTDAEKNANLVGHLKSDDFFSVEKYPTATLNITSVKAIKKPEAGKPNYEVTGDLTIKGKTNPVTFPALVTVEKDKATASAKIVVDRSKYDVRYGSDSFFDNLGDKVIMDEFELNVNLVAAKFVASN